MAAAMVSGAAALMLSEDPTLSPATVKARMMRSTRKITGDPTDVGAGVLDVTAALQETGTATAALSPRVGRSVDGPIVIEDTAQLWGDASWGAAFLFSDAFIFSDAFVFSDGSIFTDAYIWSDAAVWTDAVLDIEPLVFEDVTGLALHDDN